ncbi:tetratricopeptide repeat protein [Solibacillus silvestris]|uniref:tetratricopeptide repeat protein n=1 Tax=Solibacillus silvestris TaxID=76853 RepID=UPI003F816E5F
MIEQQPLSIEMIEHYYEIDRFQQVVDSIKDILHEHLENGRLWYMLGFSNYQLNFYEDAEEQLLEAMRLGYAREHTLYILGHIYMETEKFQKSEEAFLEALRIDPNHAQVHASYAYLMKKLGHRKKSQQLIQRAMELDPENAHVLRYYFRLEAITDKKQQQMQALEHYMNSGDSELSKLIQLGLHASLQNKEKEAREYYRQAFLLKPDDPQLLAVLEEMDVHNHPLLAPLRLMDRIGGPFVVWGLGIGIFILLLFSGLNYLSTAWIILYFLFTSYTWLAMPLVKILRKKSR